MGDDVTPVERTKNKTLLGARPRVEFIRVLEFRTCRVSYKWLVLTVTVDELDKEPEQALGS